MTEIKNAILLLGPPCAGKGTVARIILDKFPGKIACFSTGELLRNVMRAVEAGEVLTPVQSEAAKGLALMASGKLMPSELVYAVLAEHLLPGGAGYKSYSEASTIIFDGVIKHADNIQPFKQMLEKFNMESEVGVSVNFVAHMDVPRDVLMERISNRMREAPDNGGRPDDSIAVFKGRLDAYEGTVDIKGTVGDIIGQYEKDGVLKRLACEALTTPEQTAEKLIGMMAEYDRNLIGYRERVSSSRKAAGQGR